MQARTGHPAMIVPDAMQALQALGAAVGKCGVPSRTLDELSGQLAERREEIGLAVALTIAFSAAVFLILVVA